MKNHIVIYGGLADSYLYTIASRYDIIIVGKIRMDQIRRIKNINPDGIILKYYNKLGMHKSNSDWAAVNRKEAWFEHDQASGKRIVEKQYGWHLMDITNHDFQAYQIGKIIKDMGEPYDGVFLDDFWGRYLPRFQDTASGDTPIPEVRLVSNWKKEMVRFLHHLKADYSKMIFINGACADYISKVDGCMAESFVHSSWNRDSFFHNPSTYLRSLDNIARLSGNEKTLLLQSGTAGDGSGSAKAIFNYCYSSYLLVMNDNTSFYFQPQENAVFNDLSFYPDIFPGAPKGKYYLYYQDEEPTSLIQNSDFQDGLKSWKVISGNPYVIAVDDMGTKAVMFKGAAKQRDFIQSAFIPVTEHTRYTVSALTMADKNEPGRASYNKLGVEGTYYDRDKKFITAGFGLQFEQGRYGWLPFETEHSSPENAAFFRIGIGFIGGGEGQGSVGKLSFHLSANSAKVLRRDFEKGSVFVNYGTGDTVVDTKIPHAGKAAIRRNQGIIIRETFK